MDKRQFKTRKAIFYAFRSLLETKRYDHITVQEILDLADVGRSTFYAHFETKDLLLDALCNELFCPIFEEDPCPWAGRDTDIAVRLSHILWHVRDQKNDLAAIFRSDSNDVFMHYFRERLHAVFLQYIDCFHADIPKDILVNLLTGSFSELIRWWINDNMRTDPEIAAGYFMKLMHLNFQ